MLLVLEEPSLEEDVDAWSCWYDTIKRSRDELAARMEAAGIRTLPAATKGTGWSEDKPAPPPPCEEVLTLHGQGSGGL